MNIEWALVFFTLFAGLAVGAFIGIVVSEWSVKAEAIRPTAAITALLALAISSVSSVLHLGHPERIFGALGHPTSGIFLEALFTGLFGLAVIAYIVALQRNASDSSRKWIATAGAVPAVLLSFAVGYTYVMPSRPAWDTLILPLLYMASAAVMGCFINSALLSRSRDELIYPSINKVTLFAIGAQAALTIAYIAHLATAPFGDASRSAARVLTGDLALLFWIGLIFVGILMPAFIAFRAKKESPYSAAALGLLCVLVSGVAFRALMFSLGSGVRNFF